MTRHVPITISRAPAMMTLRVSRAIALVMLLVTATPSLAEPAPPNAAASSIEARDHLTALNQRFIEHVRASWTTDLRARAIIEATWESDFRRESPGSFVPDALALYDPDFRRAISAFDRADYVAARDQLAALRGDADPFTATTAAYLHARSLLENRAVEEMLAALRELERQRPDWEQFTPYAPHAWLLRAWGQVQSLDLDGARASLESLTERYPNPPRAVREGARQMRAFIDAREAMGLDAVQRRMTYVSDRLQQRDASQRVTDRQREIIELLDQLIEQAESDEQQGGGGGGSGQGTPSGGQQGSAPGGSGAERSEERSGEGEIGALRALERAKPGEAWGKLPPKEREEILQALRERYPSRYQQLVEQYYRALAEDE